MYYTNQTDNKNKNLEAQQYKKKTLHCTHAHIGMYAYKATLLQFHYKCANCVF